MRRCVTGVVALILTAVALPPLLARLTGGRPPRPRPHLAALAPAAVVPAVAAAAVAAAVAAASQWWLALLLAIPAAILLAWQLPSRRRPSRPAATPSGPGPTVRLLTLNARGGSADPAALLSRLRELQVDVLSVQELTPEMVGLLDEAGLARMLPYAHLDPRPDSPGAGLWLIVWRYCGPGGIGDQWRPSSRRSGASRRGAELAGQTCRAPSCLACPGHRDRNRGRDDRLAWLWFRGEGPG